MNPIQITFLLFGLIILFLLIHHGYTHNGSLFNVPEFKSITLANISSHEGWILILILIVFGMFLGIKTRSKL